MNLKFNKLTVPNLIIIVTVIIFVILSSSFLNNDFWQDEIYTLEHFVFRNWNTIITDYHVPNNHIAFNLIIKLSTYLLGLHTALSVLEMPFLIRLVPYFFSLLSLFIFYKGARAYYGSLFATVGLSIFSTTIIFLDFSSQMRGYSLSILLNTIQFFALLYICKKENTRAIYAMALVTFINLICLPTNIYVALTYLFICLIFLVLPKYGSKLIGGQFKRKIIVLTLVANAVSICLALLYYFFLLQTQVENSLVNTFSHFNFYNLLQAFAIFFHFTDLRIHLFMLLTIWLFLYINKPSLIINSKSVLPSILFFTPFLIFFIHGSIIIQRTFVPLLPFFCLIISCVIIELHEKFVFQSFINSILLVNLFCLIISFVLIAKSSVKNNELSLHKHDLRNHYYLFNFNARQVCLKAKQIKDEKKQVLFVWDDFGKTGIEYYLKHYKIPYEWLSKMDQLSRGNMILTNNKRAIEKMLDDNNILYQKLLNSQDQFNLYLLN